MPKTDWYTIQNANKDEATVYIYDEIVGGDGFFGGVPSEQFVKDLAQIKAKTIHLRINSPGGNVFSAMTMHGALQRHPATVIAHVDGLAASAATFVALAADEVRMAKGAFFMIHNAHAIAFGDARTLRETADTVEKVSDSIKAIYIERTLRSADAVQAWMDEEKWFTAEEAVEAGFAQMVETSEPVKACFDLSKFEHVPEPVKASFADRRSADPVERTVRDAERALRDAGFSHAEAKGIVASGHKAATEPRDEDELAELMAAIKGRGDTLATLATR